MQQATTAPHKSRAKVKWSAVSTILYPLAFGVLFFVLWQTQVLHAITGANTNTLPLPSRIFTIIGDILPKIMGNVQATLLVAITGLVAGSLLGYGIAMVAMAFPKWGRGGLSIVASFNAIPIIALAPVITNWTKTVSSDSDIRSMVAKIIVVLLVCTASMSINAFRGLTELKPFSEDLMMTYAANKRTIFLKLRLPNSIPYIFTALRVSVPTSVISTLIAEYFSEVVTGVGREIRENIVKSQYPTAWAYITVACVIGILLYAILLIVENLVLKGRR